MFFFETHKRKTSTIKNEILKQMQKLISYEVLIVLRTDIEIKSIIENNPFDMFKIDKTDKLVVCLLEKPFQTIPTIPMINFKEMMEVIHITSSEAYIISHQYKGRYGYPNNYIEDELDVVSTARNINTIIKFYEKFII